MFDFGSEVGTKTMVMTKSPKAKVQETTVYENLVDHVPELMRDAQPPKPKISKSPYPFKLKVHTWTLGDTEKFALAMQRPLSSNDRKFTFEEKTKFKRNRWIYKELRQNPFKKSSSHKNRIEGQLWNNTLEFTQDGWNPYLTFIVTFNTEQDYQAFCRRVKQRLSLNSKSMNYPDRKPRVWRYGWASTWKNPNPYYPIYIVSKGRGDSRLTARTLDRMGVPYHIAIEPQDWDEYSCVVDPEKLLVLPFSNHGDGPGRARNWVWDHAKAQGYKRHWVMDDNIDGFYRLHRQRKYPVLDGGMFRVCEEFVDRFRNVPLAGLQYDFFIAPLSRYPAFVLNTRIYSVLLIDNDCPHRWRGRYNEDTILSLDILKDGLCTMQFNNLLQGKVNTQVLGGGNTAEFYGREGTYNKSVMLEKVHPDVAKVVWRYGRYHHDVNYRPFKNNKPIYIEGYDPKTNKSETSLYDMMRIKIN